MKYKVVLQGVFYGQKRTAPGWNDKLSANNRHYQQGAKMERDMIIVCSNAIRRQLRGLKIDKPISISYTYFEADRKRDIGNICYIDKPFEDALQKCGIIPNDNQNYVRELHHYIGGIDKGNPRIEIELEELDG